MICIQKKVIILTLFILFAISGFSQTERWVYRYSGVSGWRSDVANSIVYGPDGNLYVAGLSYQNGTESDFTVISLTDSGTERWIYTYNGLANYGDGARSIVYGEDGNIYVAGTSYGSDTTIDFTVISLTSGGTERWVYQYNGPGNGPDYAYAIAYGTDGNIYATGSCLRTNANTDFTIISLTDSGAERWVYHYNGPGNFNDCGRSIVHGADGNVYAVGESYGAGTNDDFTVISLTDSGTERWVYRYNGSGNWADYANSVIYGPDSNIYVTGSTFGSFFDITVICIDRSGTERWVYLHPSVSEYGYAGVYGTDANIYVAGAFGFDAPDFMAVSLSDSGTPRWEYIHYTPINSLEYASSIVYGLDNYIYVAGCIANNITYDDFTIVSLTDSGGERWVYSYDRSNEYDIAHAICYGTDSIIYVAGQTTDSITGGDFTVISIDPSVGIQEELLCHKIILDKSLQANPNPFRDKVVIEYKTENKLSEENKIDWQVYDANGRLIKHFTNSTLVSPQRVSFVWDGKNNSGQYVPDGVYFVLVRNPNRSITKKIIKLN